MAEHKCQAPMCLHTELTFLYSSFKGYSTDFKLVIREVIT